MGHTYNFVVTIWILKIDAHHLPGLSTSDAAHNLTPIVQK